MEKKNFLTDLETVQILVMKKKLRLFHSKSLRLSHLIWDLKMLSSFLTDHGNWYREFSQRLGELENLYLTRTSEKRTHFDKEEQTHVQACLQVLDLLIEEKQKEIPAHFSHWKAP